MTFKEIGGLVSKMIKEKFGKIFEIFMNYFEFVHLKLFLKKKIFNLRSE